MKKRLIILVALIAAIVTFSDNAQAQLADKLAMTKANNKVKAGDYNGAIRIYRELYDKTPEDALLNYRMGETYFANHEYENALEHLQKAEKVNPFIEKELYLTLGKVYNQLAKLDTALVKYQEYLKQEKLQEFYINEANELIGQINTAKELMTNPVNVKVKNMDVAINSKYQDYHPSLTADGKFMVFTSRRGEVKGENRDPSDQGYYEDIYTTYFNDTTKEWVRAVPAPGGVNSEGHDANLSISPDGSIMYLYVNENGGDIFYSKKGSTERWSRPRSLEKPINSSYWESYASLSSDGNLFYFCSEREMDGLKRIGLGNGDIYVSEKIGRKEWGKPKNLGTPINSEDDQVSVFIHPDGKTLFFSSKGHKGMGGYDIFMSKKQEDGTWSEPKNLGYPINSIYDDRDFSMSTDGQKAWFCSDRPGGFGLTDIYEIDLSKYDLLDEGKAPEMKANLSILKGKVRDSKDARALEVTVQILDKDGNAVNKIDSDENGDYFITLKGDSEYQLVVEQEGYDKFSEKVMLKKGENEVFTMVKPITLNQAAPKE